MDRNRKYRTFTPRDSSPVLAKIDAVNLEGFLEGALDKRVRESGDQDQQHV